MDPIRDLLFKVPSGDIALCKMLTHAEPPHPPAPLLLPYPKSRRKKQKHVRETQVDGTPVS